MLQQVTAEVQPRLAAQVNSAVSLDSTCMVCRRSCRLYSYSQVLLYPPTRRNLWPMRAVVAYGARTCRLSAVCPYDVSLHQELLYIVWYLMFLCDGIPLPLICVQSWIDSIVKRAMRSRAREGPQSSCDNEAQAPTKKERQAAIIDAKHQAQPCSYLHRKGRSMGKTKEGTRLPLDNCTSTL